MRALDVGPAIVEVAEPPLQTGSPPAPPLAAENPPVEPESDSDGSSGGSVSPAGDQPGIASDKQSDAVSKTDHVEVCPGRPAAAQGLDITTRRPEFTNLTRITARPRSPVVRVRFDRRGRVAEASITSSSGYADVDEPVLNAIYLWRAKGKRLDQIDGADPRAGIWVTFNVLLN
jgi:TonB family protein